MGWKLLINGPNGVNMPLKTQSNLPTGWIVWFTVFNQPLLTSLIWLPPPDLAVVNIPIPNCKKMPRIWPMNCIKNLVVLISAGWKLSESLLLKFKLLNKKLQLNLPFQHNILVNFNNFALISDSSIICPKFYNV